MRSLRYAILTDGWNDPGWSAPAPDQPSGTSIAVWFTPLVTGSYMLLLSFHEIIPITNKFML
ncbi:hypothetical protein P9761_05830 [Brevibacillus centrosporus]|uniref:hypothetical protein n=1 Tax=Brevibacillus centrosporus TaxID=54910 RepID=UPI000F0A928F|nr:hypothetical protein [Brevibacillus centrosporus]MEC2129976.1 hypothetical protein [Brevibacillus centrosporus]MED4907743.1 hypothetical protein [Brevibacillus centrosporus]RNB71902.1 hypothetical protein EDM55_08020 [Brevibacillus centrosporus]GED34290.1 hypothetical protein BCE02nite_54310 [Brevibacillus centrosporus]